MSVVSAYIELLPFNTLILLTIFLMDSLTAPGASGINGKRSWEGGFMTGNEHLGVPELSDLSPHPSVEAVHLALRYVPQDAVPGRSYHPTPLPLTLMPCGG